MLRTPAIAMGVVGTLCLAAALSVTNPAAWSVSPSDQPTADTRATYARTTSLVSTAFPAASAPEFIVRFAEARLAQPSGAAARTAAIRAAAHTAGIGLAEVRVLGTGAVLLRATDTTLHPSEAAAAATRLAEHPGIMSVSPNGAVSTYADPGSAERSRTVGLRNPNDEKYAQQWDLHDPYGGVQTERAWRVAMGQGVNVAVIDTGSSDHEDLRGVFVGGYDFISNPTTARDNDGRDANPRDEGTWNDSGECGGSLARESSWHGSHVAGTIAAATNNRTGIAGIAPFAKVVPIRVLGKCGGGSDADVIDAVVWAAGGSVPGVPDNPNPAKVMNLSLGGKTPCSAAWQDAVNAAVSRGSNVVVASGNSNEDVKDYTPASCPGVISVAASSAWGNRAGYSNFGTGIDISAPGGEKDAKDTTWGILSTVLSSTTGPSSGSTYKGYTGTSMAAPHVAGVVALMLGQDPSLSPARVKELIKATARPLPGVCSGGCGAGMIDATAIMEKMGYLRPPAGAESVNNGGFDGEQGWKTSRSGLITGSSLRLLGTKTPRRVDSASQQVTIPAGSATMQFSLHVNTEETTVTTANDKLTIKIGGERVFTYSNLFGGKQPAVITRDISKFAGRTVALEFSAVEDSFRATQFIVDAVSIRGD